MINTNEGFGGGQARAVHTMQFKPISLNHVTVDVQVTKCLLTGSVTNHSVSLATQILLFYYIGEI